MTCEMKDIRRKTQDTGRKTLDARHKEGDLRSAFRGEYFPSFSSYPPRTRGPTRDLHLSPFAIILVLVLASALCVPCVWAVYGVPIINLKHAERLERTGRFLEAAADRELAADFFEFVSIPQFEDDIEYFRKIGDEDKVAFCRNTITGFQKSMKLCRKMAEADLEKAKASKEQIDKYRERNRMRMLAGTEVYPIMHNGQMGLDVNALEKNGDYAEDFEKAAEGRERTARLYEKITIPWVLREAEILEKAGKAELAAEYRDKAKVYEQKAERSFQKAAENLRKAEELRKFGNTEYVINALEDDDPSIRKLALKKLVRDINYPGVLKAARSVYTDVSDMAKEALETNSRLFEAIKADLLILALGSSDADIRKIAIEELEKIAGTTLGYDPQADEGDRDPALAQWRNWLTTKLENGLSGVYYKGSKFDREILARTDKEISFEWRNEPHKSLPEDKFSVRWMGKIKIPKAGKYTLSVEADDGARVWIGKMPGLEQIISNWSEYNYAGHNKEVYLEEGLYDLKIEYYENSKNAKMKLFWDSEDMKKHIVPEKNLFHVSLSDNDE